MENDGGGSALVAGGAGFIGCHMCERLVARGWRVTVIDNLSLGRKENFASLRQSNQFSFVEGDVTDCAELDDLFARNGL